MNKQAKIYVAGHLGLVGSAIWKNLIDKGYTNLIGKSIDELDLMDSTAVRCFFDDERPDYVFLAAAYVGGIMANNIYRADFIYRNMQIQQNVIGESYRHQVKKLLFLGSTCIYPRDAQQPIKEESLLTGPLEYTNEPYAIAKIAGLKMCESFNIQYGANFIAVMPTNLYGPNDNFDLEKSHVLPAIIRKVYLGKCLMENNRKAIHRDLCLRPVEGITGDTGHDDVLHILEKYGITQNEVTLWGTGAPLREFLWSEEMADACVYIMENVDFADLTGTSEVSMNSNSPFEGGRGMSSEIRNCHINIGTGKEISIRDLALLIGQTIAYTGKIVFDSSKPDGTMRKLTDVTKLHDLGWHHKIEIDEGVKRLYEWYVGING
jgi:GDP-L-fucose synthase